jgi:nucleoside-diphosphate-sugar epimerase
VRSLSVFAGAPSLQTVGMPLAKPTAFVTGAAGFIGNELIRVLKSNGHEVFGLTWSLDAARRVRKAGATAVMGNLLEPGQWQDQVSAEWVFHLPPHPREGARVTWTRAASITRARLRMDAHLLDAASTSATRRIVYVADTTCYGATGPRPITEDESPQPSAWGRCLAPAFNRLDGYIAAGLPIVTALPGWVYGNASWFRTRVIEPVLAGRPVLQVGKTGPWVSPIHIHDCARALVHLAEHGEVGGRYFLVNTEPIRMDEFAGTFARLANQPLRVWRVPMAASRFVVGPVLADSLKDDAVFSNARLRGIGFQFRYPSLEAGLEQIVGAFDE